MNTLAITLAEELGRVRHRLGRATGALEQVTAERDAARVALAALEARLSSPQTVDFIAAVRLEAAYAARPNDRHKSAADWFWMIGWLAGKAVHNPAKPGTPAREIRLHRIITVAAAALNWHAAVIAGEQDTAGSPERITHA
jgi:hypothetical protein